MNSTAVALAASACLVLPGLAEGTPSLCRSAEDVLFSCVIVSTEKIASVCSSPDLDQDRGYLQYRFGKAGAAELEFPKVGTRSARQFRLDPRHHLDVDTVELSFVQGKFRYSVFVAEDEDGTRGYVGVSGAGREEKIFDCLPGTLSKLGQLVGVVPYASDE